MCWIVKPAEIIFTSTASSKICHFSPCFIHTELLMIYFVSFILKKYTKRIFRYQLSKLDNIFAFKLKFIFWRKKWSVERSYRNFLFTIWQYYRYVTPYKKTSVIQIPGDCNWFCLAAETSLSERKLRSYQNASLIFSPDVSLSLIHISEPTRPLYISYAVFCLKKVL